MLRWMRIACFLVLGLACAACSTAPVPLDEDEIDPLSVSPSDFSIEITVLAPPTTEDPGDSGHDVPVQFKTSRYVLFPDGSLHYGLDPERKRGGDWLPPLIRILSRRETASVWSLSQQLGFADPERGEPSVNFKLVHPGPHEIVTMAGFSGGGRRWSFIRHQPEGEFEDAAMTQLVRSLAALSWASDRALPESRIVPKRYDFGPDPYAKYREPAATAPAK